MGIHIGSLHRTIDTWLEELHNYDFNQLLEKPSPEAWSLGQVYMHLIENLHYYIDQINVCLSTNENSEQSASLEAQQMFQNGSFPDILIEDPPENQLTPQPESKEQIQHDLLKAREEITLLAAAIPTSPFKGKTKHPGLLYFSACEWLLFADMHFRHHLRQKKRMAEFYNRKDLNG